MAAILKNETKIIYEIAGYDQVSYETFIEHIKNNALTVYIYADKQLIIRTYRKNMLLGTIIISRNVKYLTACDIITQISKKIHKIESIRINDFYINKDYINLINLFAGEHYIDVYIHHLICDLPTYFRFKFEHLIFYVDLNKKDEFDIHQQIDYMFEMIKFYSPKIMTLQFKIELFGRDDPDQQDEIVKYISSYLSEQNIEFVNSGNFLKGYHIRYVEN